jgi:RNA polymerase sporulation-specific sigma factor
VAATDGSGAELPDADLWRRAQAGDRAAALALFDRHQGLVRHVVGRLYRSGEADDLYQVGALGLWKAIQRFEPQRGFRFATYAVPVILGELRRYLRDNQWVHVGRRLQEQARLVAAACERLRQSGGREPSAHDVAEALGWDVSEVLEAWAAAEPALPWTSVPSGSSEDARGWEDRTAGAEGEPEWVERLALDEALARLSARERLILLWRFQAGARQAEVAARLHLSQVQVSRLERQALAHLRQYLAGDPPHGED